MLFNRNKEMQRSDLSFMVFRAYPNIFFDKSNIHIGHREFSLRKTPNVQSLVLLILSRVSGGGINPLFYFIPCIWITFAPTLRLHPPPFIRTYCG